MKISDKQIQFMYQVLMDSLSIGDGGYGPFKYDRATRKKYAEHIFNQQSDELVEVSDD
jgi:hypothetical protein